MDVGTVPPPWPFSVSVPQSQSGGVWWAERPPLAEEEPDFADEDFNTVCETSPPLKVAAGEDVKKKSPLSPDEPPHTETLSDKEVPVSTPVTEDDEESREEAELKEEPVSQTDLNWSDEDKVTVTDSIISSLMTDEKKLERDHAAVRNNR